MSKEKTMTTGEAYRNWSACSEAYQRKDPNVKMIRDSWQGGYTVQFHLAGTCIVTRTVSHEVATFVGKWL